MDENPKILALFLTFFSSIFGNFVTGIVLISFFSPLAFKINNEERKLDRASSKLESIENIVNLSNSNSDLFYRESKFANYVQLTLNKLNINRNSLNEEIKTAKCDSDQLTDTLSIENCDNLLYKQDDILYEIELLNSFVQLLEEYSKLQPVVYSLWFVLGKYLTITLSGTGFLLILVSLIRIVFLTLGSAFQITAKEKELSDINNRLELAKEALKIHESRIGKTAPDEDSTLKTKASWDKAQLTLSKYYDQNLIQIQQIYYTSIGAMITGLAVILISLTFLSVESKPTQKAFSSQFLNRLITEQKLDRTNLDRTNNNVDKMKEKILYLSFASGIITEFLGATFLIIFRLTLNEGRRYTESLERVSSVGTAMQILDSATVNSSSTPEDQTNLLNAKIEIAKLLINKENKEKHKLEKTNNKVENVKTSASSNDTKP